MHRNRCRELKLKNAKDDMFEIKSKKLDEEIGMQSCFKCSDETFRFKNYHEPVHNLKHLK